MTSLKEIFKKPLYPVAFLMTLAVAHVFFFSLCLVSATWMKAHRIGLPIDGYPTQFLLGVLGIAVSLFLALRFYRKI